jgi:hypothetical protein
LIRTLAHTIAAVLLTAAVCAAQVSLLEVPFLPQSELLCGGAAAAMVMRYWGASGVYADTFADLVDPAAGGIHADDLLRALRARGWRAESFRGDSASVQSALQARRPAIVLIEDHPDRFHYVVVVGWSSGRVIVHDPARAPFRVLDERTFTAAWKQSGFWTVVPEPPLFDTASRLATPAASAHPAAGAVVDSTPCAAMVGEGVSLATRGDVNSARVTLETAASECPRSAVVWRELAGLRALAGDWRAAASDARRALERDARDPHAARILATALYLLDDPEGALDAWNRVGEPVIDVVNIIGLERTRYDVAARIMGLRPKQLLTRASLVAARRRLSELPAAQTARVAFKPTENGQAQVEAVVIERPLVPSSPIAAGVVALRSVTDRELAASVSNASGGGETWTAAWRWWEHRPRVAFAFEAPAPFGGNWGIDAFQETQTYALGLTPAIAETRTHAGFHASNWARSGLRWQTGIAVDRWNGVANPALSLNVDGEQRFLADRGFVSGEAASWIGGVRTWTIAARSEWRSRAHNEGAVLIVRGGQEIAPRTAPLALWSGAGTGHGRDVLLRAHPLLDDGIVRGVFGPRLTYGGTEWRRWIQAATKPLRVAPAIFVDAARSTGGLASIDARWHTDVGTGLRLAVPAAGVLRVDVAKGLRDGRTAVSIGWTR